MDSNDFFWLMYVVVLIGMILAYANTGEED